jgi:hypothetical protein
MISHVLAPPPLKNGPDFMIGGRVFCDENLLFPLAEVLLLVAGVPPVIFVCLCCAGITEIKLFCRKGIDSEYGMVASL